MALKTPVAFLLFVGTSIDAVNAAIRRFPEQASIGNSRYHYKFITMVIKPFDIKCWTQWQSQN